MHEVYLVSQFHGSRQGIYSNMKQARMRLQTSASKKRATMDQSQDSSAFEADRKA